MPRGAAKTTVARRAMDPTAGRTLPDTAPVVPAPAAPVEAPASSTRPTTTRQTLDLPRDTYRRVQADARRYADELGYPARELSAQHLLRAMIEYVYADEARVSEVVNIARRAADERARQKSAGK